MPTYCFRDEQGGLHEVFMSLRQYDAEVAADGTMVKDGRKLTLDVCAQHAGTRQTCGNWPQVSMAAGVLPSQVGEARELAAKLGVPTEFTKSGDAVFTSASHRRMFLRKHGLHDKRAYL